MNKIRELREAKSMSLEDLGKQVGVSKVMIYYVESGRRQPSLPLMQRLADVLAEGSIDALMG